MSARASSRSAAASFIAACLCALAAPPVCATTNCEQTFELLAVTGRREPTFWIREDVGGECYTSTLMQITVSKGRAEVLVTELEEVEAWEPLRRWLKGAQRLQTVPLEKRGTAWGPPAGAWTIEAPVHDPAFTPERIATDLSAEEDRRKLGPEGIRLPAARGAQPKVLFHAGGGLYVNYTIQSAYYVPESAHLLVFTHQPTIGSGLDTLHGYLLLQIGEPQPRKSKIQRVDPATEEQK